MVSAGIGDHYFREVVPIMRGVAVVTGVLHRVVLRGDAGMRGWVAGEVPDLVRHQVSRYRPDVECTTVTRVDEVLGAALALAGPGDVVLVSHEKVQPALDLLKQLRARPVSSARIGRLADREQLVVT